MTTLSILGTIFGKPVRMLVIVMSSKDQVVVLLCYVYLKSHRKYSISPFKRICSQDLELGQTTALDQKLKRFVLINIPFMTTHEPMRLRRQLSRCTRPTRSDHSQAKLEVKDVFLRVFHDERLDHERWAKYCMRLVVSKTATYLHHPDLFQIPL